MFIGTHDAVIDEKSRLVLPAAFRKDSPVELLENDFFLTPHSGGYLIVRPGSIWDEYIGSIKNDFELPDKEKRAFSRFLYNNSTKLKLDSQHRIVLTQKLRAVFRFEDEQARQNVKFIGCGEHLEIWPASIYRGEQHSIAELSKLIDRFEGIS
jgi:division/cell wall cluster transcriptional repressor MraZ